MDADQNYVKALGLLLLLSPRSGPFPTIDRNHLNLQTKGQSLDSLRHRNPCLSWGIQI